MGGREKGKDDIIAAYTNNARSVVKISFVSPVQHVREYYEKEYAPDFAHQIFGKKERIFGYLEPLIRIAYSEASGHCYVKFSYAEIASNLGLDFVADNIWDKLSSGLPSDYYRDYNAFALAQKPRSVYMKSFGTAKYKFMNQNGIEFKAHLCSLNESGFSVVHRRFETLVLWYINGANTIDVEDPRWEVIYLYTYPIGRCGPPAVAGFCTIYKFYSYMDKVRARISQFIIFPQYRRTGVGIKFLRCVYNIVRDTIPNLKDITVEDPNENFRIIRAISNVSAVFFNAEVIAKLNLSAPKNTDFVTEINQVFKFGQEESHFIADLIMYICARLRDNSNAKQEVMNRLRKRFTRRYTRTFKCYRHSIQYNRADLTRDHVRKKFCERKREFLRIVPIVTHKICDTNITKI